MHNALFKAHQDEAVAFKKRAISGHDRATYEAIRNKASDGGDPVTLRAVRNLCTKASGQGRSLLT
jgi:hypothetical protein